MTHFFLIFFLYQNPHSERANYEATQNSCHAWSLFNHARMRHEHNTKCYLFEFRKASANSRHFDFHSFSAYRTLVFP